MQLESLLFGTAEALAAFVNGLPLSRENVQSIVATTSGQFVLFYWRDA